MEHSTAAEHPAAAIPSPALHPHRLVRLIGDAVRRCHLDLSGRVVLTEAATGPYSVTPVIAGVAGARRVFAVARSTRWGTFDEVERQTMDLAARAGVSTRIAIVPEKTEEMLQLVDIITNSGHVRPIDAAMVARLKPTAVVPLMYEAWEYRSADVDLHACKARGILVAGTNECHSAIDLFSFLGPMAVRLLFDAGVQVRGNNIVILCDNPFRSHIETCLSSFGAAVRHVEELARSHDAGECDAILVAATPRSTPIIGAPEAKVIAEWYPNAIVVQFFGDLDRSALQAVGVPFWPFDAPPPGHMGVLPSSIGPEPIVRLQTGGWKVGEVLLRGRTASAEDLSFVQML